MEFRGGYFQRSTDGNYTTDDQFVNGGFDPNVVSGDEMLNQSKSYPTLSTGLHYLLKDGQGREKAFLGGAIFNATQPNISFTDSKSDNLPISFKATAGYKVYQGLKLSVLPTARWVSQAGNNFFNIGSRFGYELNNTEKSGKKIELGVWYNSNALGVFSMAYEQSNLTIGASYDLALANDFGNTQDGIFELAISWRIKKINKQYIDKSTALLIVKEETTEEVAVIIVEEPVQQIPIENSIIPEKNPKKEIASPSGNTSNIEEKHLTAAEKVVLDRTVNFDFNSENLDNESKTFLDEVAVILTNKEFFDIELTGHSCNLGPENNNLELSLKRAGIVKDYLVEKGINEERFTLKGMGESEPLGDNSTRDGREHNRRVEFKVTLD